MVEKLRERIMHLRLGDSLDKSVDMGAVVDPSQRKTVEEYVEDARKEGAEVRESSIRGWAEKFIYWLWCGWIWPSAHTSFFGGCSAWIPVV